MTQFFDFTLTKEDMDLTTEFMMLLRADKKEYFNSDDFRGYNLDKQMSNPAHEIGTYFAKIKANGLAVPVGEIPSEIESNNKRKVDLYYWDWKVWKGLVHSTLDGFS
jgi:hypothetical protein